MFLYIHSFCLLMKADPRQAWLVKAYLSLLAFGRLYFWSIMQRLLLFIGRGDTKKTRRGEAIDER